MFQFLTQRDKILEAAVQLFTTHGFENTTMAAIQATAGVSVNTFYRYFRDKDQLGNEVYRELRALVEYTLIRTPFDRKSPRAQFHELWRQLVTFHQEFPQALRFLARRNHDAYLDEVSRAVPPIPQPMIDFLEGLRREKIAKNVSAVVLGAIVWGAFVELLELGSRDSPSPSDEQFNAAEECAWDAVRVTQLTEPLVA